MSTYVTIQKVEPNFDGIQEEDHLVTFKCIVYKNNKESFFLCRIQNSRISKTEIIPLFDFPRCSTHHLEQEYTELPEIMRLIHKWFKEENISFPFDLNKL